MEPPFFGGSSGGGNNPREEALRWLTIAEKLLTARDLVGSKSFATRARESDPNLVPAYQILAVVDTLIAAEKRINNQLDWYSILQLGPGHDSELIATQYRRLAILLNPQKNKLPFADQAFRLVVEAWSVLSNPSRKRGYDAQVSFHFYPQPIPPQVPEPPPEPIPAPTPTTAIPFFQQQLPRDKQPMFPFPPPAPPPPPPQVQSQPHYIPPPPPPPPTTNAADAATTEADADNVDSNEDVATFWTACPYCFHMYEYNKMYVECVLRCQKCKKAFHGAEVAAPPILEGREEYFCCWGYIPMGVNVKDLGKNGGGGGSKWTPFSPMFTCPKMPGADRNTENSNNIWKSRNTGGGARKGSGGGPRIYIEDDDIFVGVSDPSEGESDDDWQKTEKLKKKKAKTMKAKSTPNKTQTEKAKKTQPGSGENEIPEVVDLSKKGGPASNTRKQPARVAKDFGRLDLNVELSNEVEEQHSSVMRHHHHNHHGQGQRVVEDNFEGTGFFEGLDEFLSSLPILNAVGDDKVKAG